MVCVFLFKQKTAYEMRISDWSSDVCSSDLEACPPAEWIGCGQADIIIDRPGIAPIGDHCAEPRAVEAEAAKTMRIHEWPRRPAGPFAPTSLRRPARQGIGGNQDGLLKLSGAPQEHPISKVSSEEHTSELQSIMRITYAVF